MTNNGNGPGNGAGHHGAVPNPEVWPYRLAGSGGWPTVPGHAPAPPNRASGWPGRRDRPAPTAAPLPPAAGRGDGVAGMDEQVLRAAIRAVNAAIDEQIKSGAQPDEAEQLIAEEVRAWLTAQAASGRFVLTGDLEKQLVDAVRAERFGMGRLQPLIEHPDIENIDVNGFDEVWISYADGRLERGQPVADSDDHLIEMIRRWGVYQGQDARNFSDAKPALRLALADGSRLTAVMKVTPRPHLSLRRHRLVDVDLDDMVALGSVEPGMRELLGAAVRAHKNIVITGGMGAGKTTFVRALAAELPPHERLVTIENEHELYLHELPHRHANVVPLQAREPNNEGYGAEPVTKLITLAFRLNARRIIVGEVLGDELLPMLRAMAAGGQGSMCTLHANSAAEAFANMYLVAGIASDATGDTKIASGVADRGWLYELVGKAVDFVVHLGHDVHAAADGTPVNRRYVTEVLEVLPPAREGAEPARTQVYEPGPDGRAVNKFLPMCAQELVTRGGLDPLVLGAGWARGREA